MKPRVLPTTEVRGVAITKTRKSPKRSAFARWVRIFINYFSWN